MGVGVATATSTLLGSRPAHAQVPGRVYRLAHLANSTVSEKASRDLLLPELAKLGFVEDKSLLFDARVGTSASMPALAAELLAAKPDALAAIGDASIVAAAAATRNVPIVSFGPDIVKLGLAQSYARPGGNVTGVSILADELEVKRLSLLREAVPGRRRVAAILSTTQNTLIEPALRKETSNIGIELLVFAVASPSEYPAAFAAMRAANAEALVIGAAPEFYRDAKQLADLALEAKLPTVCEWAEMARSGCMLGYGPSRAALRKRMAAQIALIFRGTAPGDVAIELPVTFDFALNQKVAKELGIAVPFSVVAGADEVIE